MLLFRGLGPDKRKVLREGARSVMSEETENVLKNCLTEDQLRALLELEKTTHRSIGSLIREGIEMYLRFRKADALQQTPEPGPVFPPIVFDRPYRNDRNQ